MLMMMQDDVDDDGVADDDDVDDLDDEVDDDVDDEDDDDDVDDGVDDDIDDDVVVDDDVDDDDYRGQHQIYTQGPKCKTQFFKQHYFLRITPLVCRQPWTSAKRGSCIAPTVVIPVLASSSNHGRQQINAANIGQHQNVTSAPGGEGCFLSSLLNGVRQWHALSLNCAVLMSCATTSRPSIGRNTTVISYCRCCLMPPGTTPNTGGLSLPCSTS